MNILWFTWKDLDNPLAGGAEVVNEELAARLAQDGHDVVFITSGFQGAKQTVKRRDFRVVRVGSRFTIYLKAFFEYRNNWRNWPDLVIDECNTMPFFASFYTKGRQFLFFHMLCRQIWFYEFPPILAQIGYIAEPIYLRLLKRHLPVITVSNSTKLDLIRHGYKANNIQIISEGIELTPIPVLEGPAKFEQPTLLSFGTMRSMKRTLDQIQAFEIAKQQMPNLRLILVGDASGKYGGKVSEYVTRSPFVASIHQYGRVSKDQKQRLMQRSHLILSTSVKEGWGLTVTEAASQGTPAVVYDADGLRDSVTNDVTGLVTKTNNPTALAATIVSLLSDPASYKQLQSEAWKLSRQINFDHSYRDLIQAMPPVVPRQGLQKRKET